MILIDVQYIQDLEDEATTLQTEVEDLQRELKTADEEFDDLVADLSSAEAEILYLRALVQEREARIAAMAEIGDVIRTKVDEVKAHLTTATAASYVGLKQYYINSAMKLL